MIINFSETITTINGEDVKDPETEKSVTIASAAVEALLANYNDEQISGEDKLKRWNLAQKVNGGGDVDLTVEELALIKEVVGKGFGANVVGPVWTALEGTKKTANIKATA